MRILFFILVVPGCMPKLPATFNVAPDLLPYYNRFASEATKLHVSLPNESFDMEFVDQIGLTSNGSDVMGSCQEQAGVATILINRMEWDQINEWERIELTFHEMGHCILGRDHKVGLTRINSVSIPVSIMDPNLFDGWFLSQYYDYYMEELFHAN